MGTNFYWITPEPELITLPTGEEVERGRFDHDDPRIHIGKRSAAGMYCWSCRVTLHKHGEKYVHTSARSIYNPFRHELPPQRQLTRAERDEPLAQLMLYLEENRFFWHDKCPKCGKGPEDNPHEKHCAGSIELGLQESGQRVPQGVTTCCSFRWAQSPTVVERVCWERPDDVLVCDEYDNQYTGQQFMLMLKCNCPIRFEDSIGSHFS